MDEFSELSPPYSTIVADPPWHYTGTSGIGSQGKKGNAAADNYPTITNTDLRLLRIKNIAARNAHLYMWVTVPRLFAEPRDLGTGPKEIMEAWGFRYVTMLTWVKTGRLGLGRYFRGQTEHVLFGVRGSLEIPPEIRQRNVFEAPRPSSHSTKPAEFMDLVETVSPGPYVEMFARQPRLGWDSWGNGYE